MQLLTSLFNSATQVLLERTEIAIEYIGETRSSLPAIQGDWYILRFYYASGYNSAYGVNTPVLNVNGQFCIAQANANRIGTNNAADILYLYHLNGVTDITLT